MPMNCPTKRLEREDAAARAHLATVRARWACLSEHVDARLPS